MSGLLEAGSLGLWEGCIKRPHPQGTLLVVPASEMPDGKPYQVVVGSDINPREAIEAFYNTVKGEYRAREDRQESETNRSRDAAKSDNPRPLQSAGAGRRPAPRVEETEPVAEAPLEEVLKARRASVHGRITANLALVQELQTRIWTDAAERDKLDTALRALGHAPEVRKADSKKPSGNKKRPRRTGRERLVEGQVRAPASE